MSLGARLCSVLFHIEYFENYDLESCLISLGCLSQYMCSVKYAAQNY